MPVGYHVKEPCLVIAFLLTSSIEPIVKALKYVPSECYDPRVISENSIVMVVACKHLINPTNDILSLFCSFHTDAFVHLLAFLCELLAACSPLYFKLSSSQ